jgi:hypothetical protein
MPGFDGTGPESQGPMTGRGAGYCAVPGQTRQGYVGLRGRRMLLGRRSLGRLGLAFRRGRGRGRRLRRW